jgi:deazaflavin-dependent oxidoreductase (nitroreductase family)
MAAGRSPLPPALRQVDPSRPPSRFARAYAAVAATPAARFISRHIGWKLDPFFLRISGGRLASTLIFPTALLQTIGARSGLPRRNAVIYFHDGAAVIVVASHAGIPRHPAWFHNLVAHPDVHVGGIPMTAEVVRDEAERQRLWLSADRVFPAYSKYRREADRVGRTIPIVRLTERREERSARTL